MSTYFVSYTYYAAPSSDLHTTASSYSHGFGQMVVESDGPFSTQDDFDKLTEHAETLLREKRGVVDPEVILLNVQRCPI